LISRPAPPRPPLFPYTTLFRSGPAEAGRMLAAILKPFEDFKVYGASTTTSRATGGTDSTSFNAAGLPGIGGSQDPIEYNSHTHQDRKSTRLNSSHVAISYAVFC